LSLRTLGRKSFSALNEGGFPLFASKTRRSLADRATVLPASRALRATLSAAHNIDDYLDTVYDFKYRSFSIAPTQIRSEIASLLGFLEHSPPRSILEIGTGLGGTIILFASVASEDATLITVDFPLGIQRSRLLKAGIRERQKMFVLRRDSHDTATFGEIAKLIDTVDFLFIDGDHSFDGVRQDYSLYAGLVHSGGSIAFHDIVPGPEEAVGGVPRFWEELKRGFETCEFVESRSQEGFGIGVLSKP
jgi:predicted O-methyltransferase YrrM